MGCFQGGQRWWDRGVVIEAGDDTRLLRYGTVGERVKSASPVFCIQPPRPWSWTSFLTLFLASRAALALMSEYVALVSASSRAGIPAMLAICAMSVHALLRQILLAPRGSVCFLPCRTPPIRVSCHDGVNTALRLLATAFSCAATPRRLQANSLCVGLTSNGCHL